MNSTQVRVLLSLNLLPKLKKLKDHKMGQDVKRMNVSQRASAGTTIG